MKKISKNSFSVLEGIFAKNCLLAKWFVIFLLHIHESCFFNHLLLSRTKRTICQEKVFLKSKASKNWITRKQKFHQY